MISAMRLAFGSWLLHRAVTLLYPFMTGRTRDFLRKFTDALHSDAQNLKFMERRKNGNPF